MSIKRSKEINSLLTSAGMADSVGQVAGSGGAPGPAGRPRHGAPGEQPFTAAERAHATRVAELVGPIVGVLAEALRPRTEVVLHDLTKTPNSIVAIGGAITGRDVGGPPTDLGMRVFRSGWRDHLIGYRTETADGVVMRSSSIFFHASSGRAVACLCLNTDINGVLGAQDVLAALTAMRDIAEEPEPLKTGETFPVSVDGLAEGILRDAITSTGVPVGLMKKAHKVQVVRELDRRGFFAVREAVDIAAKRLEVSRYTIYNYLNELQAASDTQLLDGSSGASPSSELR